VTTRGRVVWNRRRAALVPGGQPTPHGLLVAEVLTAHDAGSVPEHVIEQLEPKMIERALLLTTLEWRLVEFVERLASKNIALAAVKAPPWVVPVPRALVARFRGSRSSGLCLGLRGGHGRLGVDRIPLIVAPPSRRAAALLGKGLTLRHDLGFEIDLHHTLVSGGLGFG